MSRLPLMILAGWLLVAACFSAFGGLTVFPPPFPQALLGALVLALAGAYVFVPRVRDWADGLPGRWILALHLSRFVGIYFLVLHDRGELPFDFAVLGGWGDIVVAVLALVLLVAGRGRLDVTSPAFQVWNAVGLIDITFVVATAGRLAMADPESMAPLTRLPLGLLPTWLVPLIFFTHGIVVVRGVQRWRGGGS